MRAFVATDCEGMARADLFVRDDGEVLVNELNTIPGFTSTSVYARLFAESGVPYGELLDRLATLASNASTGAASSAIDAAAALEPLAADRRPPPGPLGRPIARRLRRAARADARRAASSTTACRSRSGGSCTTRSSSGFLRPRLERAGDRRVPHTGEPRRPPAADRGGLRLRRRDLAALLRGRQPPGGAELHQLVRARGRSVALHLLDRLRPTRRAVVDDRDDLSPAARRPSARRRRAESSSARCRSARARG